MKKLLLIGYGNPGRGDDGLGPALAEAIEQKQYADVEVDIDFQLNVEDAYALEGRDAYLTALPPWAAWPRNVGRLSSAGRAPHS